MAGLGAAALWYMSQGDPPVMCKAFMSQVPFVTGRMA